MTKYYYVGGILLGEEDMDGVTLYLYDAEGSPIGMQYHSNYTPDGVWETYIYEKNLQGDIVSVYTADGTKLITYYYDAWGNTSALYSNNGESTNAAKNNLTYRGYYYDRDTGLYYLKSRYYDPKVCRFVSPDDTSIIYATPTALTDKNLYAYCDNNPVMRVDGGGAFWNIVIGAAAGLIVGVASSLVSQYIDPTSPPAGSFEFWAHIGVSAVAGMFTGALAASGVKLPGQVAVNAVVSAVTAIVDTRIDDKNANLETYVCNTIVGAAVGALSGLVGGPGSASKHVQNSFWRSVSKGFSNFRYYYSQVATQSTRDGFKSIASIIKAAIPNICMSSIKAIFFKYGGR